VARFFAAPKAAEKTKAAYAQRENEKSPKSAKFGQI
jgi:hypothetical protein